jgi:hypothetical protein
MRFWCAASRASTSRLEDQFGNWASVGSNQQKESRLLYFSRRGLRLCPGVLDGSSDAAAASKTTGRGSGWPYSLPRLGWAGPWRTANRAMIPRSMWRLRSRASIRKSPGSCEVSRLKRLAELQRAERDKILNFATRTKNVLASVSGTNGSNPASSSGESIANLTWSIRANAIEPGGRLTRRRMKAVVFDQPPTRLSERAAPTSR